MSSHDWRPDAAQHREPRDAQVSHVDYGHHEPTEHAEAAEEPTPHHASEGHEHHVEAASTHVEEPATSPATPAAAYQAASAGRKALARLALIKRETRIGIATLLSFLILVTAFIVNRGKAKPENESKAGAPDKTVAIKYNPDAEEKVVRKLPGEPIPDEVKPSEPGDPTPPLPSPRSNDPNPAAIKLASADNPIPPPSEGTAKPEKPPTPPPSESTAIEPPKTESQPKPAEPDPAGKPKPADAGSPPMPTEPGPPVGGPAPSASAAKSPSLESSNEPAKKQKPALPPIGPGAKDTPPPVAQNPPAPTEPPKPDEKKPEPAPGSPSPPPQAKGSLAELPPIGEKPAALPPKSPGGLSALPALPDEKSKEAAPTPGGPTPAPAPAALSNVPPANDKPAPPAVTQPPAITKSDPPAPIKPLDHPPSLDPTHSPDPKKPDGLVGIPSVEAKSSDKPNAPPMPEPKKPDEPSAIPSFPVEKPATAPSTLEPPAGAPGTAEPQPAKEPSPFPSDSGKPATPKHDPSPFPDDAQKAPNSAPAPNPSPFDAPKVKSITSEPSGGALPTFSEVPRSVESTPASVEPPKKRVTPLEPGWVPLRKVVKSKLQDDVEVERPPVAKQTIPDNPPPRTDRAPRGEVEPVLHKVARQENFWTISRLYYGTGRYYRALWSYNRSLVPNIRELYVGTVIKVPAPEVLDRSMIEPVASGSDVSVTTSSGENKPRPATFPDMGADTRVLPSRRPISKTQVDADLSLERSAPVANAEVDGPSRPTYRVRPYDTLRSIAKHTLGDARRDREILELNRDLIPDPRQLTPGQTLVLPEDATIASRVR